MLSIDTTSNELVHFVPDFVFQIECVQLTLFALVCCWQVHTTVDNQYTHKTNIESYIKLNRNRIESVCCLHVRTCLPVQV